MTDTANAYEALLLKSAQDAAFREALIKDPKATLEAHLGTSLPEDFKVNIVSNTATELTLVIPPKLADELSDAQLDEVSGGDFGLHGSLITLGIGCIISAAANAKGKTLHCNPKGKLF